MTAKSIKLACSAAIAMNFAASTVHAGSAEAFIAGAVAGTLLGAATKPKSSSSSRKTYAPSPQRQANREMQAALNYFGFPAGTPDGVIGSKTRTAASQFQIFMGYPATGTLTQYERDFLVASHNRAQIGGPEVIKAMQGPAGVRGLLHTWRDEAAGVTTARNSYGGLPDEVSQAIDEVAESSEPSAEQLLQRSGFLLLADLNNDGRNDYVIDTSVSGSSFWCGPSHCSVMVFASTPSGYVRNDFQARGVTTASFSCHQSVCRIHDTPQTQMAVAPNQQGSGQQTLPGTTMASAAAPGLPSFDFGSAPAEVSLASMCSKVSLLTNSNGGYITAANMVDPELALGEQFCLTRTYAIGVGEQLVTKVNGATQQQIDSQCDGFGAVLDPVIATLPEQNSLAVRSSVQKFALQSNMSLEQLTSTAQICLFSGYRRDNMKVALGSALVLVGVGEAPYAELVGHHLSQGFGVAQSPDMARGWYEMAISALNSGSEPVFAPGQPERIEVIQAAALGAPAASNAPIAASATTGGLPSFSLD